MPTKACLVCCTDVSSFSVSPKSCIGGHRKDERACGECWEAYLSQEVEGKAPDNIRCMFYHKDGGIISSEDLNRLARKGTITRYEGKLQKATCFRCQARCWWSKQDPEESDAPYVLQPHNKKAICVLQPHNRQNDGRVFTCEYCDYKTCIDCDRPEHEDETCDEYRARVVDQPHHNKAEVANGKNFKCCPSCAAFWKWGEGGKGCGYTKCEACKYRFCGNCMIPWVGEGSAYLLGKSGHKEGCRYRTKDTESTKALMKRHESHFQATTRIDGSNQLEKARKESKMEAKMVEAKRKAAEAEEGEGLGLSSGKVAKKQKLTTKA